MKKDLLKFLVAILAVVGVVVCLDWLVGKALDRVLPAISKQGQNGITYYSLNEVDAPVVVVGSSRAVHHYDTRILSDSLRAEVYNVGRNGCFFSYNCCVINSILDRYTPEMIIWETSLESLDESHDPLESLHPFYRKNKYATEYINEDYAWNERFPLISNLYKYNSNIIRIISRYIKRFAHHDNGLNGYIPIKPKSWIPETKDSTLSETKERFLDGTKIQRFKDVLQHAKSKGVRLIIVDSPIYLAHNNNSQSSQLMQQICDSVGIEMYDFRQATGIYDKFEYFGDGIHLNENGALAYTNYFIENIPR